MRHLIPNKNFRLYAVCFSDGRIKIGVSGTTPSRMRYYEQEARRNRVSHLTWWACAAFTDKRQALWAERALCEMFKDIAMDRHREWFDGAPEQYSEVISAAEEVRVLIGGEEGLAARDLGFHGLHGFIRTEVAA